MATKVQVIDLLAHGFDETQRFVQGLSAPERDACGQPDHWAAKDILAHVAEWQRRTATGMASARRGETPTSYPDYHQVNAEIFASYCSRPFAEVLEVVEQAHRALIDEVQVRTDEELTDPQRNPWADGRPLWTRIVGGAFVHVVSHYDQYYLGHGERERADQLQEQAAALLAPLDESPAWRGQTIYNLACHYALAGEKAQALARLREALSLDPVLVEWSKEDSDLDCLRGDPEYHALYA